MLDSETPVDPGPRTGTMETTEPSPLREFLSATMEAVAAAKERGEITRDADPALVPAPVIVAPYDRPYVPSQYRATTFDSFDPEIAGPEFVSELRFALRAVKRWTKAAIDGRRAMIALVGPQGNGKSTLLYAAVNALAAHHVRVFSRPWYRLADELRYGGPAPWDVEGPNLEPHDLRRRMYRAPVVAIDEVRGTSGTAFDDTELAKFACHAWDEGRAVLITTNVNPLAAMMGDAAADRFTVVTLTAPSRRQVE